MELAFTLASTVYPPAVKHNAESGRTNARWNKTPQSNKLSPDQSSSSTWVIWQAPTIQAATESFNGIVTIPRLQLGHEPSLCPFLELYGLGLGERTELVAHNVGAGGLDVHARRLRTGYRPLNDRRDMVVQPCPYTSLPVDVGRATPHTR